MVVLHFNNGCESNNEEECEECPLVSQKSRAHCRFDFCAQNLKMLVNLEELDELSSRHAPSPNVVTERKIDST